MQPTKLLMSEVNEQHEVLHGLKPAELEVEINVAESNDVAANEKVPHLKAQGKLNK